MRLRKLSQILRILYTALGLCLCIRLLLLIIVPLELAGSNVEDAVFERRGSALQAADLSKRIAKEIKCEVCVLAAGEIAGRMEEHAQGRTRFKHEGDLLEIISGICRGRIGQEPIDRVLEKQSWEVVEYGSGQFKLEQRELDQPTQMMHELENSYMPLKGSEFTLGRHKRDSIQEACMLSVGAHTSELTESLFMELMQKRIPNQKTIAEKLCLKISDACLLPNPAAGSSPSIDEVEEDHDEDEEDKREDEKEADEDAGEDEDDEEDDEEDTEDDVAARSDL